MQIQFTGHKIAAVLRAAEVRKEILTREYVPSPFIILYHRNRSRAICSSGEICISQVFAHYSETLSLPFSNRLPYFMYTNLFINSNQNDCLLFFFSTA